VIEEAAPRVLLVEDNASLAGGLARALESEGYEVEREERGDRALERLPGRSFDLVILDLMLPGATGFDVLRHWRRRGDETPVLILSARGEEVDRIQGFRCGADDYVVKPVGVIELLLRAGAILKRAGTRGSGPETVGTYAFGDVLVNEGTRTVTRRGDPVPLSRLEFDLLVALLRARGRAVAREDLLRDVWGFSRPERIRTRTIDTHIASLRGKLEPRPSRPTHILTVRKVGYRIDVASERLSS